MIPREVFQETLLQLFAPIRAYLEDDAVSEILINGPNEVFIEREGRLLRTDARFANEESLVAALRNAAQFAGQDFDEDSPILEGTLPDGSRLSGVLPPIATAGPYVAIRRFLQARLTTKNLIEGGCISSEAAEALSAIVHGQLNVVIAGGTGTGKTSMLNWLTSFIHTDERVGVIEDCREIQVQSGQVFQLESRAGDLEGRGKISVRDLFRASLRLRPDRIIVGEVRGGEAVDLIQSMVSGHGGTLSTLHASHPRDALTRLETLAIMGDQEIPLVPLRLQMASGLDVVVQLQRARDGRRFVSQISEVLDYDAETGRFGMQDLFIYQVENGENGSAEGLVRTAVVPSFVDRLRTHGVQWPQPKSLFR